MSQESSDDPVVGICCSGGGIRAASFALGALQTLQANGQLHGDAKAKYLSAVSGGSYTVGALASVQTSIEDAATPAPGSLPAFAPGSPEEHRLRNRLGYLTHGPGGVPLAVWRLFLGIVVNVLLLGSIVLVAAVVAGWAYGAALPQLRWYCGAAHAPYQCATTHVVPAPWTVFVLVGLVGAALVVGIASVFSDRPRGFRSRIRMSAVSGCFLVLAIVWAVFVLGMPQLLAWLHRVTVATSDPNQAGRHLPVWSLAGVAGVLAAAAGLVAPVLRFVHAGTSAVESQSWLRRLLQRIRKPALNLLMMISVPLFLVGAFVWFAKDAAADPPLPGAHSAAGAVGLWAGLAGGALLFLAVAERIGNLNRWSLHAIYEDRLNDAFSVERCPTNAAGSPTITGFEAARTRPTPLRLSQSQPKDLPEVLVCATANIFQYGIAPTARGAAPFLFSAAVVGSDDTITGASETSRYQLWGFNNEAELSLPMAISISGAAVAPEMGKETRRPLRFLLALANIRLGVWLPKPWRLADFGFRGRTPGPSYLLLHEMLGVGRNADPFVYVTDGGHYDNLGLVELFKRKCDWIWCIDASGDAIDTFSTLGGALAIAEADFGVTVDIHPDRDMAPPAGSRFVRQPFCFGSVTYHDEAGRVEKTGGLVVVKAGVPENAPWSVCSYHADHNEFPCDPTLDQLYTADRFDAYLELGRFSMQQAWQAYSSLNKLTP